jgi:hypothetical protein
MAQWHAMPVVTELSLKVLFPAVERIAASASFLSNFTNLQHLVLHSNLDA